MHFWRQTLVVAAAVTAIAASRVDNEWVQFDRQTLYLASDEDKDGEHVKAYLPERETFESWTRLASIREYRKLDDPHALAMRMVRFLKQKHPEALTSLIENKDTGEVILDFVFWTEDESYTEFDLYRYSRRRDGGLLVQQYAIRAQQPSELFLKQFLPRRGQLVELMAKNGLRVGK